MLAGFAVVYSLFIINYSRVEEVFCSKRVKRYGVANSELSLSNHDVGEASEQPSFSASPAAGPANEFCLSLSEVNCHSSMCKKSAVSTIWVTTYIPGCDRGGSDAVRLLACFSVQDTVPDLFSTAATDKPVGSEHTSSLPST